MFQCIASMFLQGEGYEKQEAPWLKCFSAYLQCFYKGREMSRICSDISSGKKRNYNMLSSLQGDGRKKNFVDNSPEHLLLMRR